MMEKILSFINEQLHPGQCPTTGCIGECACIDETRPGSWWAAIYIWDDSFNDSTLVASWFHKMGAGEVLIRHVLHDEANGDVNGKTFDGVRAWHVDFEVPESWTVRAPS